MKDWKSTAAGILSFLITTLTTLNGFLVAGNMVAGGVSVASIHVLTWATIGINVALALCRGWIGLITTNADAGAVAMALQAPIGTIAAQPSTSTLAATPVAPAGKALVTIAVIALLGSFLLTGCTNWERDTFNGLAASKAVIEQAQKDYTAGTIKETACSYAVINDAKAAQTVAVNAMVIYETAKNADNEAAATLAVAGIVPLVADVKLLYSNPAGCKIP
jgi:hypothetical protein